MSRVVSQVQLIEVDYLCDICSTGYLRPTGNTDPAQAPSIYEHRCDYDLCPTPEILFFERPLPYTEPYNQEACSKLLLDMGKGGEIVYPQILSSNRVNLNEGTNADQPLYTVPTGRRAFITDIALRDLSAAFAFINNPDVSFGWDGVNLLAGGTPIFPATLGLTPDLYMSLANFIDTGTREPFLAMPTLVGNAADVLSMRNNTAEGSFLSCVVDVVGYLADMSGFARIIG